MSQYNNYAKRLDEAFQTALSAHNEAKKTYEDTYVSWDRETDPNEKRILSARLDQAKAQLDQVQRTAWKTFRDERDRIERELFNSVSKAQLADPDAIDDHAIALLNSGIMTGRDLAAMADRYKDNATMRRMIGNYARTQARDTNDPDEQRKLSGVAYECNRKPEILEKWDTLKNVSVHYSGEGHEHADATLVSKLAEHWNDDNVRATVADF